MKRKEFIAKTGAGIATAVTIPFVTGSFATSLSSENLPEKVVRKGDGKKLNVLGDKMTVKLTGDDTAGQYALIEENNEPGVGIPLHVHENEDEIFRVIEGQLEIEVGDRKFVLGPGDTAFCPRGIPHTWKVVGEHKAKVDLSFFPAGLEKLFEELAKLPAGPPDMEKVTRICREYGVNFIS